MERPGKPGRPGQTFNQKHFYDLEHIASATECTGLIPAARNEDELDWDEQPWSVGGIPPQADEAEQPQSMAGWHAHQHPAHPADEKEHAPKAGQQERKQRHPRHKQG